MGGCSALKATHLDNEKSATIMQVGWVENLSELDKT